MNILIRSDASGSIGTGHVMRGLILAKQFKSGNVTFASRPLEGNLFKLIQKNGFNTHALMTNGFKELSKLIEQKSIDLLIIDHYDLDFAFEKKINKEHPSLTLMVLDDNYKKHHCDILLNHNIYAKKKHYKNLVPKETLLLCGAKYTLLRDEFFKKQKKVRSNSMLIAMGGSDSKNLTLKILKSLPLDFPLQINIITTNANKNLEKLKKYIKNIENIKLHIQTQEVARLAKESSFAIITPSGFANELYSIKVPFIAIQSANNQSHMSSFLQKKGYGVLESFSKKEFLVLLKNEMKKVRV